jgi:hypothetical protein
MIYSLAVIQTLNRVIEGKFAYEQSVCFWRYHTIAGTSVGMFGLEGLGLVASRCGEGYYLTPLGKEVKERYRVR